MLLRDGFTNILFESKSLLRSPTIPPPQTNNFIPKGSVTGTWVLFGGRNVKIGVQDANCYNKNDHFDRLSTIEMGSGVEDG